MNTPTTTTAGSFTTISAGVYRLQQLAKQAGIGMDTLALALGGGEFAIEAKPTTKVVLQRMEAEMLQVLTLNLDRVKATSAMQTSALRDQLEQQAMLHEQQISQQRAYHCQALEYVEQCYRLEQAKSHALQNRSFWQRLRG